VFKVLKGIFILSLILICQQSIASILRDPTKPFKVDTVSVHKERGSYTVTAIIISEGEKKALINNKLVKEGELVEGAKVEKIGDQSVILKDELGEKLEIHLYGSPVKGEVK